MTSSGIGLFEHGATSGYPEPAQRLQARRAEHRGRAARPRQRDAHQQVAIRGSDDAGGVGAGSGEQDRPLPTSSAACPRCCPLWRSIEPRARRWDEGLQQVESGIALTEETRERVYAAELWRIKGELLFGALRIARSQEARSLELRSTMSLVRLSRWRKGCHHALAQLRSLVASFTEGFDTKDLQDARVLLSDPERRTK